MENCIRFLAAVILSGAKDRTYKNCGTLKDKRDPSAYVRFLALLGMTSMNITAVLLAGGESRRMGKDKATLLFRGKPLWRIQVELLRKLKPAEIFVSARTDPSWRPDDVQFVLDDPPSRGPLSGLAASLAEINTAHLLVLAIDMPFMTEQYLKFLCDQIEPGTGVAPTIDNRAEPLAAIYPREASVDFQSALAGADFSLQTMARRLVETGKLREIFVTEEGKKLFLNMNEVSDLQRCSHGPVGRPARENL
jgi:molybdopterin-guanine dinucleotide biosynthesis protein A